MLGSTKDPAHKDQAFEALTRRYLGVPRPFPRLQDLGISISSLYHAFEDLDVTAY